jgi:hypothetical protein
MSARKPLCQRSSEIPPFDHLKFPPPGYVQFNQGEYEAIFPLAAPSNLSHFTRPRVGSLL